MQNKETKKIGSAPKQKGFLFFGFISIALVAVLAVGGYLFIQKVNETKTAQAAIGNELFTLEVADTDAQRQQGLSERDSLPENTGMLFVFNEPGDWRMWMVQMRFPIDIAWLDENKTIVHIKHSANPAEYPETYKSPKPALYVVEVPDGTFNRLGVNVGDSISFKL